MDFPNISVSSLELWYLFSKFSPGCVIGFKDPTKGWSIDAIKRVENQLIEGLINRGIIDCVNGEITLSEDISKLLFIISNANHAIIVVFTDDIKKEASITTFYEKDNAFVELIKNLEQNNDLYTIKYGNKNAFVYNLYKHVEEFNSKVESKVLKIHHSYIQEVLSLKSNKNANINSWAIKDTDQEKEALLRSIIQSQLSISIVSYSNIRRNMQLYTRSFAIFAEAPNNIWMIEPIDSTEKSVKASLISKEHFKNKLVCLMP